jgi:hypothetical protein
VNGHARKINRPFNLRQWNVCLSGKVRNSLAAQVLRVPALAGVFDTRKTPTKVGTLNACTYSYLRAVTGSTFIARLAGM